MISFRRRFKQKMEKSFKNSSSNYLSCKIKWSEMCMRREKFFYFETCMATQGGRIYLCMVAIFLNKPEETRIFPYILGKMCPYFNFNYSRFGVQKSKESTARIVLFKSLKIPNIFTLESSF